MRIRATRNGLSVHAIAGTEVVLFGLDVPQELAGKLLGFGFERTDDEAGATQPLRGLKTFAATEAPEYRPGTPVSTLEHPVQAFLWGDYVVEPGHDYTYRVVAFGGVPERLEPLAEVLIPVQTERPHQGRHSIHFNRGAAASQAYVRQFGNRPPDAVTGRRAWTWLSRGLGEALTGFIDRAMAGDTLRAAVYEFHEPRVLDAFRRAHDRGADVQIVMHAKRRAAKDRETGAVTYPPRDRNIAAVETAGIGDLVIRRETNPSYLAHNKFIVHGRGDQPLAVWTGSTNITEGGIYGQANVGHAVRDPAVAARFLDYWEQLAADPEAPVLRAWNARTPIPPGNPPAGITTVFSPRATQEALDWYAALMDSARSSTFFTAAFGISPQIEEVLGKDVAYLRYGLLETEDDRMELLKRDRDNVFTVGTHLREAIGGWAAEKLTGLNGHVNYVHTKFMLIDPLSADPIVITGSANFSKNSSVANDENMLVIRGSTRVADIYLTEFMRLFNHFEFRERIGAGEPRARRPVLAAGEASAANAGRAVMASGEATTQGFRHLDPEPGWALEHFVDGYLRTKERELFR